MNAIMWFRRDLRLRDNPALREAVSRGEVLPLFVLEPSLWERAGDPRRGWLAANLQRLNDSLDGHLVIKMGRARDVVPRMAKEVDAASVHAARDFTPFAHARDTAVVAALQEMDVEGVATGSPYVVEPGTVSTKDGSPFKVFTPYSREWLKEGWDDPQPAPRNPSWVEAKGDKRVDGMLDKAVREAGVELPTAGEDAAKRRWDTFVDQAVSDYDDGREHPAVDGTSRLSPYLHLGVLHPRQLLEDLKGRRGKGVETFRSELAWRDFYAEVLHAAPSSAWEDLNELKIEYSEAEDAIQAWRDGRTGYPFVDAGMRQLLAEGWMHNRVRMVTASFLTKDLHVWWPVGARHFLDHLIDGDIASNNHGWQWVAGTGTDASPYFRVFNPVTQGERFDPQGEYVRRWVPELAHLAGKAAHQPWQHDDGYDHDYPERIVDHAEERKVALSRYEDR